MLISDLWGKDTEFIQIRKKLKIKISHTALIIKANIGILEKPFMVSDMGQISKNGQSQDKPLETKPIPIFSTLTNHNMIISKRGLSRG